MEARALACHTMTQAPPGADPLAVSAPTTPATIGTADADRVVMKAEHLAKHYGARQAVIDASFSLHRGEVFGFLGPNGAGKTTTIRMLVGLVRPTAGRVLVAGYDLINQREEALAQIGCIVESPDFYDYLTGRENLEHAARMIGPAAFDRIERVCELLRMRERLRDRVGTYSLGMRQRLGIAQALLGDPSVLVLDEPANGLDPAGIFELRGLVRQLADKQGLAVFVSSHLLGEVEKVCDRIAIVHRGRVLAEGNMAELTAGGRSLEAVFMDVTGGETVGD